MDNIDVVVIGGGISGLAAAYELKKSGVNRVVLLEAKDRLGGRTEAIPLKAAEEKTGLWDVGGQWVGKTQADIMDLLKELGIGTYPQYHAGMKLLELSDGRKQTYSTAVPLFSWLLLLDYKQAMQKLDEMTYQVPIDDPMACPRALEWDALTLEDFKLKNTWTQGCRDLLDIATRIIFGTDPSTISLLYALHYFHCGGGFLKLAETSEGSTQELKIEGTTGELVGRLAEKLGVENILCNCPVTSIDQFDKAIEIQVASGETYTTQYAILAAPPQEIMKIEMDPALPSSQRFLFNHMPVGHLIKCILTYETAFWKDDGYSGEIISSSSTTHSVGDRQGEPIRDSSPVSCVWDATTADGLPALVVLQGGKHSIMWSDEKEAEIERTVLAELEYYLGPKAGQPISIVVRDWADAPYNGGCPVSTLSTGAMSTFGSSLRLKTPLQRLHFAGTELATSFPGYMSGAVQSGKRAAREVLHRIDPAKFAAPTPPQVQSRPKASERGWTLPLVIIGGTLAAAVGLGLYFAKTR
ncbi:probable flavin-containing monoamine oxidase A isoform X2 [Oscarella lobularis]